MRAPRPRGETCRCSSPVAREGCWARAGAGRRQSEPPIARITRGPYRPAIFSNSDTLLIASGRRAMSAATARAPAPKRVDVRERARPRRRPRDWPSAAGPSMSATPARTRSTARALECWSNANNGTTTIGTPCVNPRDRGPEAAVADPSRLHGREIAVLGPVSARRARWAAKACRASGSPASPSVSESSHRQVGDRLDGGSIQVWDQPHGSSDRPEGYVHQGRVNVRPPVPRPPPTSAGRARKRFAARRARDLPVPPGTREPS